MIVLAVERPVQIILVIEFEILRTISICVTISFSEKFDFRISNPFDTFRISMDFEFFFLVRTIVRKFSTARIGTTENLGWSLLVHSLHKNFASFIEFDRYRNRILGRFITLQFDMTVFSVSTMTMFRQSLRSNYSGP